MKYINSELEFTTEDKNKIKEIEQMISNKQIPYTYPKYMIHNWSLDCYKRRSTFISKMGFILLSWDWLNSISEFLKGKRCLEVMAGTGSLTHSLKQLNINIKATDDFSWNKGNVSSKFSNYWTEIQDIDAIDSVRVYGKDIDVIIMSWAYMDDIAYKVLKEMREVNPNCEMIFIGEGYGGCTASDEFFDEIIDIENEFIDKANVDFQSWHGIHDCIRLVK